MSAKIPPRKLPKGYELVPVGEVVQEGDLVCHHPFNKWSRLGWAVGAVRSDENYIPYGYYARRKAIKRGKKK